MKFEKATEPDWQDILNLLSNAAPIENFTSLESYKNFFIVKDQGNIICCFAIDYEGDIGIFRVKGSGNLLQVKWMKLQKLLK